MASLLAGRALSFCLARPRTRLPRRNSGQHMLEPPCSVFASGPQACALGAAHLIHGLIQIGVVFRQTSTVGQPASASWRDNERERYLRNISETAHLVHELISIVIR